MRLRKLLALALAFCILCTAGAAFAADPPAAERAEPVTYDLRTDEEPEAWVSAVLNSCLYAVPPSLARGLTVEQFLRAYAYDNPDPWVCTDPATGERAAQDAVVCTGMHLYRTTGADARAIPIVVKGDVLGQGRVSLSQLTHLAAMMGSVESTDPLAWVAADMNQDGVISLTDLCEIAEAYHESLPPAADAVIRQLLATNVLDYIPASTYQTDEYEKWYRPVLSRRDTTLALPGRYAAWLAAAADNLHFGSVARVETDFDVPSWPLLAAIAANYKDDPDGMREALNAAVVFSVDARREADGNVLIVTARPGDPTALFYSLPYSSVTNAFSLSTSYAYLSTVFDDAMQERYGIGLPDLEPFLFPIQYPSRYYVGDCWYLPRDQGARKHTGTDINAPQGTNLLACVNGTIIGNGWDNVAGNYVVLRGGDGTQYHYYHLVERSDVPIGTQVRRGDVVGHVGSTGNSRANHLHFTIVTAGGQYVNPVQYLQRAQTATANGSIRPA